MTTAAIVAFGLMFWAGFLAGCFWAAWMIAG
jgi:hypothetical protein